MKLFNLPLGMSHSLFLTSLLPLLAASPLNLKRDSNSHEAPAITNNPTDIVYRADFPTFNSPNVVGIVQFYSLNGTTKVHIDLTGLPKMQVCSAITYTKVEFLPLKAWTWPMPVRLPECTSTHSTLLWLRT